MCSLNLHDFHYDESAPAAGGSALPLSEASSLPADSHPASAAAEDVPAGGGGSHSGSFDVNVGIQPQKQPESSQSSASGGPVPKRARDGTQVGADNDVNRTAEVANSNGRGSHPRRRPPHNSVGPESGGSAAAGVQDTTNTGFGQQLEASNALKGPDMHTVAAVLMIAGQSHPISVLISINRNETAAKGDPNGSTGTLASGQPPVSQPFGPIAQQQPQQQQEQQKPLPSNTPQGSIGPNKKLRRPRAGTRRRSESIRSGRGNMGGVGDQRNPDPNAALAKRATQTTHPDAAGENGSNLVVSYT